MPINKNIINKAVILAGGKGKRFRPYSFVLPKPLIPFQSNEPLISNIINKVTKAGIKNFHFSLGYLDILVKSYLLTKFKNKINLNFITEKKELGTAGPLRLINKLKKGERLFILNGDIITDLNFKKILKYYEKITFDILVFVFQKKTKSSFGIIETRGLNLTRIVEKPTSLSKINTGIYIINSDIISLIPKNSFFTMVDLINLSLKLKKKVIIHEFTEKWKSIESPEDLNQ